MSETKAKVKIRTREERQEAGKSLRERCPRQSHGEVVLGQGERDIVALIEASNEDRLENLIPIRHGRMLQSPFAYFRGTALVQAHNLAGTSAGPVFRDVGDCRRSMARARNCSRLWPPMPTIGL
jgi:hypothetical protein